MRRLLFAACLLVSAPLVSASMAVSADDGASAQTRPWTLQVQAFTLDPDTGAAVAAPRDGLVAVALYPSADGAAVDEVQFWRQEAGRDDADQWTRFRHAVAGGAILASGMMQSRPGSGASMTIRDPTITTESSDVEVVTTTQHHQSGALTTCGVAATLSANGNRATIAGCADPVFRRVGDHFVNRDGVRAWLDDAPVPVRVEVPYASGAVAGVTVYARAGGAPDMPTWTPRATSPVARPELLLVPPTGPTLWDDAGLDHPFPLSEAFAVAAAESGVARFLSEGARLSAATVTTHEAEDATRAQTTTRWTLRLSLGNESMTAYARHEWDRPVGPTATLEEAARRSTVSVTAGHYGRFETNLPAPGHAPRGVPVVADLVAWAKAATGRSGTYGFDWSCPDVACQDPVLRVHAGQRLVTYDGAPMVCVMACVRAGAEDTRLVHIESDGNQIVQETIRSTTQQRTTITTPLGTVSPPGAGPTTAPVQEIDAAWIWTAAAIAGTGLVAAALVLAAKFAGIGLFSRHLGAAEAARHPRRAELLARIEAEPGIHVQGLMRATGSGHHVVDHHLRVLRRKRLVQMRKQGRYTCYFIVGQATETAGLLKAPAAKRILATIENAPGISNLELADRLDLSTGTVSFHVRRLRDAGVLTAKRDGRAVGLFAAA